MGSSRSLIRLHVKHPLGLGQCVPLDRRQNHYLINVMRCAVGDRIAIFNGKDGEWEALIAERVGEASCLQCTALLERQKSLPDVWLLFAPLKKTRTDYAVEKATELGVQRIMPVATKRTIAKRVSAARLEAVAVEATEQCGGMAVPEIEQLRSLQSVLADWPDDRRLFACDELAQDCPRGFGDQAAGGLAAVLIGPEGGFAESERRMLAEMRNATRISLGDRVLRAETAVAASLALLHDCRR